jgi:hypothetical protein
MALTVKRITLWRAEVENQPGVLARTLAPLAGAGTSLRLVMGYGFPGAPERAAIEVHPVSGKRATAAAQQAGLASASTPCLLVEGDDQPGLGAAIGRALAEAGINIGFVVAMSVGRRFAAAIGLHDEAAAAAATGIVRKAAAAARPKARKPKRQRAGRKRGGRKRRRK